MSVERVCQEVGELLRKDFDVAGFWNDSPDIIFYAKIDDGYMTVSFHVEDLVGINKYEILNRVYTYWL